MKLLAYLEMWGCTESLLAMFSEESNRFLKIYSVTVSWKTGTFYVCGEDNRYT